MDNRFLDNCVSFFFWTIVFWTIVCLGTCFLDHVFVGQLFFGQLFFLGNCFLDQCFVLAIVCLNNWREKVREANQYVIVVESARYRKREQGREA